MAMAIPVVAPVLLGIAGAHIVNSTLNASEVQELSDKVQGLSLKVGELQGLVSEFKSLFRTDSGAVREIVHIVNEELKKDAEKHGSSTGVYVFYAILAVGYGCACMNVQEISISDICNRTKRCIATGLSTVTKCIERKSAAVTERMKLLTEKMDKYAKLDQENDGEVLTEASKLNRDQEYADSLMKLVMTEGKGYHEDILAKVFDHLNEHPIVARGFLSKPSEMRKKWLKEFQLEGRFNCEQDVE